MNTAEKVYSEKTPNETTIKAMQAAEHGEYEAVSLDDLKKQWSDA